MAQRQKVVRDNVLPCAVLYNILRTHQGRPKSAFTPADDIAALQNEQFVYVPDEGYTNPLKEAKHQQDLLKDYFCHVGTFPAEENRIRVVARNYHGDRRS